MNIKRNVWIAGGLIAAMVLGGLVAASGESPLAALGSGCCRVAGTATEEPTPLPVPLPDAPEPASSAP